MKASFNKFRAFIEKHIWADFLFIFLTYGLLSYFFFPFWYKEDDSFGTFILNIAVFALIMTPILRLMRPREKEHNLYDFIDHVRYYQVGQRAMIKAFLENQEYSSDYNEGAVSYFKSERDSILSSTKTFIHETDHWIALVAPPHILDKVPNTITSIYPKTT